MSEKREREKATHEEAKYENPSRHDEHCGICTHFIRSLTPRCEVVKSSIASAAWCKWYAARKRGEHGETYR
jgi:hypothetical protein